MNKQVPSIIQLPNDVSNLGFDRDRLMLLTQSVTNDIEAGRYDGVRLILARRGETALDCTIGFNDRDKGRALKPDDVFCIMSLTKSWTAAAVLNRVERGDVQLTTRVAEVIPEFGINGKQRITLAHLLTHTSGMPLGLPPLPVEQMGDLEANVKAICAMAPQSRPGQVVQLQCLDRIHPARGNHSSRRRRSSFIASDFRRRPPSTAGHARFWIEFAWRPGTAQSTDRDP